MSRADLEGLPLEELRRLARSRPTDGRSRLAKLGAIRTLERLERKRDREPARQEREERVEFGRIQWGLLLGPGSGGPFDDDLTVEEMEEAWAEHRERVMDEENRCGRRCWAWWMFEAREPRPQSEAAEGLRLLELGELGDDEIAAVRQRARDVLRHCERTDYLEYTGCIVAGPREAAESMRARRDKDAAAWRGVLAALEHP